MNLNRKYDVVRSRRHEHCNIPRGRVWLTAAVAVLVGAVIMTACGKDAGEGQQRGERRRTLTVVAAPVVVLDLNDVVAGLGTIEAVRSVWIKPEVNGRLLAADFEEGSFVAVGRPLFKIDDDRIKKRMMAQQAALDSAGARLDNLRRNYERIALLRERNQVSEEHYDVAATELRVVSADVERLRAELSLTGRELADTVIRAPFDGVISRRLVDPGTFVSVGEPLAMIYRIDLLRLAFFIGEKYAGRVAPGQDVFISATAFPETHFKGRVEFISPVVDPGTRKFLVRADIVNSFQRLMPGSFASASLVLETRPARPVVPEQALIPTRDGYIVYLIDADNGVVHKQRIETGLREPGLVEITDGLTGGELVVVYGHLRLDEGSPVSITERWDEAWPGQAGIEFFTGGEGEQEGSR